MTCYNARQLLHIGPSRWEAVRLRLHLLHCAGCREEARAVHTLGRALAALPHHQPSPVLLSRILAVPQGSSVTTPIKEKRTMRRFAYVAAIMLAIAALAVLVLPGRGRKQDARTILAGVAHAMEQVTSIHQSGRAGNWQGLMPGRFDTWLGPRATAGCFYDKDSGELLASRADIDARKWWFYDGRKHTLYVADLTPVIDRATRAIPRLAKYFLAGHFEKDPQRYKWPDAQSSVTTETRDGRPVKVVTINRKLDVEDLKPPLHVTDRYVYVVDPSTERLLALRRYFMHKDGTEVLIEDTDKIEYDVAIPGEKELLAPATDVHTVSAAVTVVKEHGTFLTLTFNGERLNEGSMFTTMEVPRGK